MREMLKGLGTYNYLDLEEIFSNFSAGDRQICDFIFQMSASGYRAIFTALDKLTNGYATCKFIQEASEKGWELDERLRIIGAVVAVWDLRNFAGHTVTNIVFGAPHSEEIVLKCHRRIAKRNKTEAPDIASIQQRLSHIASLLAHEMIKGMNSEELEGALKDSEIADPEKRKNVIVAIKDGGAGILLKQLVAVVGKKATKDVLLKAAESHLTKKLGTKKAAEVLLKKVGAKLPQKAFATFTGYIAMALWAKAGWDLAGEATRVTMPFVQVLALFVELEEITPDKGVILAVKQAI